MRVRMVRGKEKMRLRAWYSPFAQPHARVLDALEMAEAIHLYRSNQATAGTLARRYGVSLRTMWRYIAYYPEMRERNAAAERVLKEAVRIGIPLSPADAERLAAVALLGERAA